MINGGEADDRLSLDEVEPTIGRLFLQEIHGSVRTIFPIVNLDESVEWCVAACSERHVRNSSRWVQLIHRR